MVKKHKSFFKAAIFAVLFLLVLSACSNSSNTEENSKGSGSSGESSSEGYPITIEHAFGETVLDSKPERVATIQWGNQDVALALGVVPVGFSAANFGVQDDSGLLPWTAEKLEELGEDNPNVFQDTDGLDFEAIADSQPDVILAAYSGITEEDYNTLSEIAPVVAYPTSPWTTSWRDQVTMNAKGMGMEQEGEQLIEDTENLIAEKVDEHPEIKGKKVAWVNFSANDLSEFHLYTPADSRVAFLEEMGMEFPESISDLIEDDAAYSLNLSAENADVLNDVDLIIGYGDDSTYEAVKNDSRLGQIKAIQNGAVVFIANNSDLAAAGTPNPLAIEYTIDNYVTQIEEALSNNEQ
ncbi:iron-siderophore ABC transporter substrate-binding protein [Terribacillus sp. 179-K 1B1 HS]|uniref:iron-siderophore ABC transporter substrate-binding protein n=1 Tax=Terribacillus sp. 179-K 1B1 HS TaxID=3142388 RepID=UPI0039A17EE4